MPLSAEQKRDRRAALAAARSAADAARGIKRQPPGGVPAGRRWDERVHAFVLAAQPLRPAPSTTVPDDVLAWAAAHPPPRRPDFDSQELWDSAREPWYATFTGKLLPPYGDDQARITAWGAASARYDRVLRAHELQEADAREEQERQAAEREATRARQAAQDAADAPLIEKLIDCERRTMVEYHVQCKQWHHPNVPCDEAHLYPMRKPLVSDLQYLTGTMYVEGVGAVKGKRAEWPFMDIGNRKCRCLPEEHPRFCAHCGGRHVPGTRVIRECAHHELCRRNGVQV